MSIGVVGIRGQRGARNVLRIGNPAELQEQTRKVRIWPAPVRNDGDSHAQRLLRGSIVSLLQRRDRDDLDRVNIFWVSAQHIRGQGPRSVNFTILDSRAGGGDTIRDHLVVAPRMA